MLAEMMDTYRVTTEGWTEVGKTSVIEARATKAMKNLVSKIRNLTPADTNAVVGMGLGTFENSMKFAQSNSKHFSVFKGLKVSSDNFRYSPLTHTTNKAGQWYAPNYGWHRMFQNSASARNLSFVRGFGVAIFGIGTGISINQTANGEISLIRGFTDTIAGGVATFGDPKGKAFASVLTLLVQRHLLMAQTFQKEIVVLLILIRVIQQFRVHWEFLSIFRRPKISVLMQDSD